MAVAPKDNTKYTKNNWHKKLDKIRMWKRQGQIDLWIAKKMGIKERTLYEWMIKYPEFKQAMSEGRDSLRAALEQTIFTAALTTKKTTKTVKEVIDKKTGDIVTLTDVKTEDISNTTELLKSLGYLSKAWSKGESEVKVEVFASTDAGKVLIAAKDIVIPNADQEEGTQETQDLTHEEPIEEVL